MERLRESRLALGGLDGGPSEGEPSGGPVFGTERQAVRKRGNWRVGDGEEATVHTEIQGTGGAAGAAGRADNATDCNATRVHPNEVQVSQWKCKARKGLDEMPRFGGHQILE